MCPGGRAVLDEFGDAWSIGFSPPRSGGLICFINGSRNRYTGVGEISEISVPPRYRMQGIADCLLRQAAQHLALKDTTQIDAIIEPDLLNTWLMSWYLRKGFRRLPDRPSGHAQLTTTLQTLRQEFDLKCCLVMSSRELEAPSS